MLYKVEKQENRNKKTVVAPDTSLTENNFNDLCLKPLRLEEVNHAERKDANLRNISDSLKIKTEIPGSQKYPGKIQGIVMGWEKILTKLGLKPY